MNLIFFSWIIAVWPLHRNLATPINEAAIQQQIVKLSCIILFNAMSLTAISCERWKKLDVLTIMEL